MRLTDIHGLVTFAMTGARESTNWFGALTFLSVGLFLVIGGVRFRIGHARAVARYHGEREFPLLFRNFGFGLIPMGVGSILWGVGLLTQDGAGDITFTLIVAGCVLVCMGILLMYWAPDWSKPRWLRDRRMEPPTGPHG